MPTREHQIGTPADWIQANPHQAPQFQIGDSLFEGTGVTVTRYRTYGGRDIVRLELLDGILIEDGTDQ